MAMAWLWTGMVAVSLVFGILTGSVGELGGAALEGATAAVELCVSMAGIMCLWTGVMEVMDRIYPQYSFAKHKGYPSALHKSLIAEYGPSPIHRLSFRGVLDDDDETFS